MTDPAIYGQVIATLRSEKAKDILLDDLRGVDTSKLSNPILDISKEADAQRLARTVKAAHPSGIDHAISSLGAWWQKGERKCSSCHVSFMWKEATFT